MRRNKNVLISLVFVVTLAVLALGEYKLQQTAVAQTRGQVMAPRFEVDPTFPKPLPNGWYQGQSIGLFVDANDHVWIVHRPDVLDAVEGAASQNPPAGECCNNAPPILEFDQAGNVLRSWGGSDGPGYKWPQSNHGVNLDNKGNVWIGGNGTNDGHVLKFTQDGKFIAMFGRADVPTPDSLSTDRFHRVAETYYFAPLNEVFVADGYSNRRVAVIDPETGKMKRFWGAYGNKPDDKAAAAQGQVAYDPTTTYQQFRGPVHCAVVSNDGLVYVCDRTANRIQIFKTDGTYVREIYTQRDSRSDGSVWDIDFSRDAQQRFLYVADGRNQKIRIFDRASMTELTTFGKGGHYPGEWYSLHNIALDSKNNLYTVETYQGRRLQRFLYKGLAPVTSKQTGVAWPTGG